MDQPRLDRLLRLLLILATGFGSSLKEIALKLEISQRSVYRYIDTLRNAGFIISCRAGLLRIEKESPYLRDIADLLHFTTEESWILNKAILALDDETVIKQSLARKLYSLYDLKGVPYPVVRKENCEKVIRLIRAIEEEKCVCLKGYHSSHSGTVADRKVEPFEFTLNYGFIWCYESSKRENKLFKTARITRVEILDQRWKYGNRHKTEETDIFRITGPTRIPVKMKLTLRATNLLTEEYPMSEDFIVMGPGGKYLFSGWVSSFSGIGRFAMGLMNEVEILEPAGLRDYINSTIRNKYFSNPAL